MDLSLLTSPPRVARTGLLLVLLPLFGACGAEVPADGDARPPAAEPAAAPPKPLAPGFRLHTEPVTGVRFPVLAAGVMVEARHFDATLPDHKFKHSIRLVGPSGTAVLIDVWNNPQRRELHAWFTEHLGFLVGEASRVSERAMTLAGLPGILIDEPASEQATSQAIAIFAHRDRVFRVTCIDPEGSPSAREMFDKVIDEMDPGGAR